MGTEQPSHHEPREKGAYFIRPVTTPEDLTSTAILFREYAASLDTDLSFQDFNSEVANLPGKYSQPTGALLLSRTGAGNAVGCVGLRSLEEPGTCEMKKLYVSPLARGTGLGKALALEALDRARKMGYCGVRLDTLRSMASAMTLYEKLGFSEVEPYYKTPLEGTRFLELSLEERREG